MLYDLISGAYDRINSDIDYKSWADFIERIIEREYGRGKPELILDLGCGTGSMTLELAKRGYDMTGVDGSVEMLDIARERAEECGVSDKMLWLCQDMTEFELYGTVDVTVSCLDCINHLTQRGDIAKCFALVHNYLSPDGLFIFDINGKYKFENIYANETYVMEDDGEFLVWQNSYDPSTRLCDFYMTLFKEQPDGSYRRSDDVGMERMYTLRSIKKSLCDAGFEFIGAYSNFDFDTATDENERIYIVAKCKK